MRQFQCISGGTHTYHRTGRGAACSTIVVASRVLHGGDPQLFVNTWTQVRIEETIGISEINASVELSPYENCNCVIAMVTLTFGPRANPQRFTATDVRSRG